MANISGATVSRVLSGRTDVAISAETRSRVMEAARVLGYQPNPMARALMTRKSGLVGFWMSLQYSRYRSQVLDRMRTVLRETEIALAITDVDEEYQWDHSFARALRVPVEGIIAFDTSGSIDAFAREYDRLIPNIPFVSMGAYWAGSKSYVGVDLKAGAEEAMEHLISTGRKRIAFMAPYNSGLLTEGIRFDAYRSRVSAAGMPIQTIATHSANLGGVQEAISEIVGSKSPPDAILCMNDDVAISAAFALDRLGIRPGHEIALVGFDGIEETEHVPCPITTVKQPIEEMCNLAFQFLRDQMEDPSTPIQHRLLKPSLIVRESSKR